MSIGYEILTIILVFHAILPTAWGIICSLIPKRPIALTVMLLPFVIVAVWYIPTFNIEMLFLTTFYLPYIIFALIGYAIGTRYIRRKKPSKTT